MQSFISNCINPQTKLVQICSPRTFELLQMSTCSNAIGAGACCPPVSRDDRLRAPPRWGQAGGDVGQGRVRARARPPTRRRSIRALPTGGSKPVSGGERPTAAGTRTHAGAGICGFAERPHMPVAGSPATARVTHGGGSTTEILERLLQSPRLLKVYVRLSLRLRTVAFTITG